jgi:hypothetical protein
LVHPANKNVGRDPFDLPDWKLHAEGDCLHCFVFRHKTCLDYWLLYAQRKQKADIPSCVDRQEE